MSDLDALLAAVNADPANDEPRLVYADWLFEHQGTVVCPVCNGEPNPPFESGGQMWAGCGRCPGSGQVSDGRAERAEFIRVQCELARLDAGADEPTGDDWPEIEQAWEQRWVRIAALRRRERELWGRHKCQWFGDRWAFLCLDGEGMADQFPDLTTAVVRRGFVDEVRMRLANFLPPCGRCRGGIPGVLADGAGGSRQTCPDCGGTGRDRRPARDLFAGRPIERVVLTDKQPDTGVGIHTGARLPGYRWWRSDNADELAMTLPGWLFDLLLKPDGRPVYATEAAAVDALSAVMVGVGRDAAGLPPLRGTA